jgi:ribosomal protein S18 acetylase RimI-like enzyme
VSIYAFFGVGPHVRLGGVQIRRYVDGDRAGVLRLAPRLQEGVAAWRDPDAVVAAVVGWVEGSLDSPTTEVLVAVEAAEVLGFVSVSRSEHWTGAPDAYIGELVVDHAAEGYGTGAANTAARAFYAALGFAEEGVRLSRAV